MVDDLQLKEIHLNGRAFTWTNARERSTLERINRVFVSTDWEALFLECFLRALLSSASDHCSMLLYTTLHFVNKKLFCFESFWTKLVDFQEVAKAVWCYEYVIMDQIRRLDALFEGTIRALQSWSQLSVVT